jgi:hypothetical protein
VDNLWINLSTAPIDFYQQLIVVDMKALKQINHGDSALNLIGFLIDKNLRSAHGYG